MTQTEYRFRASECMQLAHLAHLAREPQRSKLLELAKAWLVLAHDSMPSDGVEPSGQG
jgi:hypothetical protein